MNGIRNELSNNKIYLLKVDEKYFFDYFYLNSSLSKYFAYPSTTHNQLTFWETFKAGILQNTF